MCSTQTGWRSASWVWAISLVEKAQNEFDEVEAQRLEKKIKANKFDFNDFLGQMQMIKKMGDFKSLIGMIPGVSKALKDAPIDDKALVRVEAIIQSMTPKERANPELINLSRKKRLAKGCGQTIDQINLFIRNFDQMRTMMHQVSKMSPAQMQAMQKQMSGMKR
jgi:signal recognition particle subunit SRP54